MPIIGLIGGSGLTRLDALEVSRYEVMNTPYGDPSAPICFGSLGDLEVAFLPRHGVQHHIPPHQVNYRANIAALADIGVTQVIGMAAVGGISDRMCPGTLCIADQIIDYTWGRAHTYFEGHEAGVEHVDFTHPYCETLRSRLIAAAFTAGIAVISDGTYGATEGPRLETAAEIQRMARDGCHLVGMTGMPEASLAREKHLCYANLSLVVNWAAGLGSGPITMQEIDSHLADGMHRAVSLIQALEITNAS